MLLLLGEIDYSSGILAAVPNRRANSATRQEMLATRALVEDMKTAELATVSAADPLQVEETPTTVQVLVANGSVPVDESNWMKHLSREMRFSVALQMRCEAEERALTERVARRGPRPVGKSPLKQWRTTHSAPPAPEVRPAMPMECGMPDISPLPQATVDAPANRVDPGGSSTDVPADESIMEEAETRERADMRRQVPLLQQYEMSDEDGPRTAAPASLRAASFRCSSSPLERDQTPTPATLLMAPLATAARRLVATTVANEPITVCESDLPVLAAAAPDNMMRPVAARPRPPERVRRNSRERSPSPPGSTSCGSQKVARVLHCRNGRGGPCGVDAQLVSAEMDPPHHDAFGALSPA